MIWAIPGLKYTRNRLLMAPTKAAFMVRTTRSHCSHISENLSTSRPQRVSFLTTQKLNSSWRKLKREDLPFPALLRNTIMQVSARRWNIGVLLRQTSLLTSQTRRLLTQQRLATGNKRSVFNIGLPCITGASKDGLYGDAWISLASMHLRSLPMTRSLNVSYFPSKRQLLTRRTLTRVFS